MLKSATSTIVSDVSNAFETVVLPMYTLRLLDFRSNEVVQHSWFVLANINVKQTHYRLYEQATTCSDASEMSIYC